MAVTRPTDFLHVRTPALSARSSEETLDTFNSLPRRHYSQPNVSTSSFAPSDSYLISTADQSSGLRTVLDRSRRPSLPVGSSSRRLRSFFSTSNPLLEAARLGDAVRVEALLSPVPLPSLLATDSRDQQTALHFAAAGGHAAVLQVLIPHFRNVGASLDPRTKPQDRTPLFLAAQAGHMEAAQLLCDGGAEVNAVSKMDGATSLHAASLHGQVPMVALLIGKGAMVDAPDTEGLRPLMWAIQTGRINVAEMLIDGGADLEARSTSSRLTALHRAVSKNDERMVKLLLERGADANADAPFGMRSLHRACMAGHERMVEILLQEGKSHIEVPTVKGWTPLHCAARQGHKRVCEMLLIAGANRLATTRKGKTASMLANERGFQHIVEETPEGHCFSQD